MKRLLQRLRGLFGLGALGGVVGAVIGGGWYLLQGLTGGLGPFAMSLGTVAALWGILGSATGVGFGLLLTATSSRLRLEDVSLGRAGFLGAVAGAVGPLAVATMVVGSAPPLGIGLMFAGVGASLGAALGSGLLAIAKQGERTDRLEARHAGLIEN